MKKLLPILFVLVACNDPNGELPPGDICSYEGVEECAPDCEVCLDRDRYELQLHNARQYGFQLGVESCEDEVVYMCKTVVCTKTGYGCEWQWEPCDGPES